MGVGPAFESGSEPYGGPVLPHRLAYEMTSNQRKFCQNNKAVFFVRAIHRAALPWLRQNSETVW